MAEAASIICTTRMRRSGPKDSVGRGFGCQLPVEGRKNLSSICLTLIAVCVDYRRGESPADVLHKRCVSALLNGIQRENVPTSVVMPPSVPELAALMLRHKVLLSADSGFYWGKHHQTLCQQARGSCAY